MQDKLEERALFILKDDITDETVLAVLSALQAFENNAVLKNIAWNKTHKTNRVLDFKMFLVCDNREYDILWNRCLGKLCVIYSGMFYEGQQAWTYVTEISIDAARAISRASNRPLAESIGILIGSEAGSLPDVSNLCAEYEHKIYALIDSALPKTFLDDDYTRSKLKYNFSLRNSLQEKIEFVFSAKMVIGYSSFETYLACALKKPVVEIQTSFNLLKWSNPNYHCISVLSSASKYFEEILAKGVHLCCQQVIEK